MAENGYFLAKNGSKYENGSQHRNLPQSECITTWEGMLQHVT